MDIEASDYNIQFKLIAGVKTPIADTLSRLINLDLTEPNPPEIEGHQYGYAIFEPLPEIHISKKSIPKHSQTVTSIETSNHDNAMADHTKRDEYAK